MCLCTHYLLHPFFLLSAYTEAYNVCLVAAAPQPVPVGDGVGEEMTGEEDQGRTSEEEEGAADSNYDRQVRILDS